MVWPILVLDKFGCCFLDSGDIWRMKSNLGMAHYGTERVQGVHSMRAYMSFLGNLRDGPLWFWTPQMIWCDPCCHLQSRTEIKLCYRASWAVCRPPVLLYNTFWNMWCHSRSLQHLVKRSYTHFSTTRCRSWINFYVTRCNFTAALGYGIGYPCSKSLPLLVFHELQPSVGGSPLRCSIPVGSKWHQLQACNTILFWCCHSRIIADGRRNRPRIGPGR